MKSLPTPGTARVRRLRACAGASLLEMCMALPALAQAPAAESGLFLVPKVIE